MGRQTPLALFPGTAATGAPAGVLQVIPLAAGAHEGMRGGAFVLADFSDAPSSATNPAGPVLAFTPERWQESARRVRNQAATAS